MDQAGISELQHYARGFPREHRYKTIVPSSKWTENSNNHCLLVDLPGFKEEPICYMNSAGEISIMGTREVNETTSEHFAERFTLPPNSDASKYTVKFVNEILYVTVPKVEPKNEGQHGSNKGDGIKHGDLRKLPEENGHIFVSTGIRQREEEGGNIIRTAMEMLNKNKAIVMNAVVAFSLVMLFKSTVMTAGVAVSLVMLVYRKFQSAGD